jgi:hypothetical protein
MSGGVGSLGAVNRPHPESRRDPKVRAAADFLRKAAADREGLC